MAIDQQDPIIIDEANPAWPSMAQAEIAYFKQKFSFPWLKDIVHIGSTAIPDLPAKPIIDLAIGVTDLEAAKALVPILEKEGYAFWDENPDQTKLFFVKGMPPFGKQRTHHIHVMRIDHHDWIVRPLFRDYLITHPEVKQQYQDLKQTLAQQFRNDREAYTETKTEFIRSVNREAIKPVLQFQQLQQTHLPLLKEWLTAPHIKAWWDQDLEKYTTYIKGYKIEKGKQKPIQAYIATIQEVPVAYLQLYNAYDFERDQPIPADFPKSLAAVDLFIGNATFVAKGLGGFILDQFLQQDADAHYEACLVDPDSKNTQAIRAYEHAGFNKVMESKEVDIIWMLRYRSKEKS